MSKLIVVSGPTGSTVLAQPADLAADLGLTLSGADGDPVAARLISLLTSASAVVSDYIGRPLLMQTLQETFSRPGDDLPQVFEWRRRNPVLVLSAVPVSDIESLTVGGLQYLPPDGSFDLDAPSGILRLPLAMAGFLGAMWQPIAVTYHAGYVLPGATDEDGNALPGPVLPETIRLAVIELAAMRWQRTGANTRDPSVVREQTEGVGYTEYAPPPAMVGSLPADIAARLDAYRDVRT